MEIADVLHQHFPETIARLRAGGIIAVECRCGEIVTGLTPSRLFAEHQAAQLLHVDWP